MALFTTLAVRVMVFTGSDFRKGLSVDVLVLFQEFRKYTLMFLNLAKLN